MRVTRFVISKYSLKIDVVNLFGTGPIRSPQRMGEDSCLGKPHGSGGSRQGLGQPEVELVGPE